MKLKIIIILLLAIFINEFSFANFYQKGDTLNVWATSGLNMREGPGTDFPKIKKLEYGDRVEVIDDYLRSTPLNITVIKKSEKSDAFVMEGFWVRVKIGSQEGYVFDGYLSRLPVLKVEKITENGIETWQSENMDKYISREIGSIEYKSDTLEMIDVNVIEDSFKAKKWISFESKSGNCYEATTVFHDLTFQEVFLYVNILHRFEEVRRLQEINPEQYDWLLRKVEKRDGKTIFNFGEELWGGDLYEENGKIIFAEGACC